MIALLLTLALALQQPNMDATLELRTREVAAQLRCPVCQGVSLEDSPSTLAQEMKSVVREQLRAGKSEEEVKQYFVQKYGEWILLEPEPTGFNLAVYVLPVVLLLGGGVTVFVLARKWSRQGAGAEPPPWYDDEYEEASP